MKLQTINDVTFLLIRETAEAPVAILFTAADDVANDRSVRQLQVLGDAYEEQIIFARIWWDEHPALVVTLGVTERACPFLAAWHRGEQLNGIRADLCAGTIRDWLEDLMKRA